MPSVAAADCTMLANRVVAENCKPGSPASEWDVAGAGSPDIQGFATDISANAGSTIHFKIKTPATAYRLDIYRMGYYGGDGARRVTSVSPSASLPQSQPDCAGNAQTGLVDCGNWADSAAWAIPADAVSGIYFARLVRTDGVSGASHIVFVVRDDDGHSDLLFQTSDTTWQAYNQYGGHSLYEGGPGSDPDRAYKVSYNRPVTTRATTAEDSVFNAEYPMVRWLERNGYDVSYTTGVDSDRRGGLIPDHRVFLSVGHDEYWSRGQRTNVEAARNAGVSLAFFSGNEIFWKTRWEDSGRTLVSYKDTHNSTKLDPLPNVWTGSWRDPRPFNPEGAQPENALTGTIFMVNFGDKALEVPPADGGLRLWRGSTVASAAAEGRTSTLTEHTVGYEWDEDVDNGSRPAGLVRLSTTTANDVDVLQDYGHTFRPGNATHHATLYRDTNGAGPDALVFGAGTIQWSWGLDDAHDRGSPGADPSMQQATVNLFADMGVQPGSLQTGTSATASTDTQAPATSITFPTGGATVAAGLPVTVWGTAADAGGGRVGAVEVSTDGGSSWHPATGRESWSYTWTPSVPGQATILSRAADDSANLGSPASATVGVSAKTCPCTLFGDAVPASSATDGVPVEVGLRFTADGDGRITALRYYSPGGSGQRLGHLWTESGVQLAEVTFPATQGWHEVALATPVAVTGGSTYVASFYAADGSYAYTNYFFLGDYDAAPLHAPAADNGVYFYAPGGDFPNTVSPSAANYFADVAFVGDDHTPPRVIAISPANDASGVDAGAVALAAFDEDVDPSSLTEATFQLRDGSGRLVPAQISYSAATRTATLRPLSALAGSTTYSALVKGGAGGVRDRSANPLAQDRAWSFTTTTAPVGDRTPPHLIAVSPVDGASGVDAGAVVTARFDEDVDPSSLTAATFQLRDGHGTLVPADVTYLPATRTATLRPRSALAGSTTYSALVKGGAGGVHDPSANPLAQDRAWSFTTMTPLGGDGPSREPGPSGSPGADAGAGTPGAPTARGPSVKVTPKTVRVSRSATVSLRVSCPPEAGRCRVTLRLTLRGKTAARRTLIVAGGRSTIARLKLSRAARRLLARHRSLPAVVTAVARDQAGEQATTRTSIRLHAPRS